MKKLIIIAALISGIGVCSSLGASIRMSSSAHTLVLNDDGTVWACGLNTRGQLGNGTTSEGSNPTPARVVGLTDVIAISSLGHSLALKRDGTVWAWGLNDSGELGDGTTIDRSTPVKVVELSNVISIEAGRDHSLALKQDGTVWSWGWNWAGQLGDGTHTDRSTPGQVTGLVDVIAIAAGGMHSMAVKRDGTAWAWGENWRGQLGDGTYEERVLPVQVVGLTNVIAMSADRQVSMALTQDGMVWSWGYGPLGDGTTSLSLIPVKSAVDRVIDIAVGPGYSYALTIHGTVWWWGKRMVGWWHNLSLVEFVESLTPVPLEGISGVKAIGDTAFDSALALKNDGTIWGWGINVYGQLGDGTTIDRPNPIQVFRELSLAASPAPASILAADFDEDGRADPIVVDNSGQWFFWHSSQSFSREGPIGSGMTGQPAAGDANGDGKADMAMVDAAGLWYFFLSGSNGYSLHTETFGQTGTPLLADFDGDRKADPAIVSATGVWYFWLSADGYSPVSGSFLPRAASGAISGATPVAADFDADGRADPVMVTSAGGWYLWPSSQMYTQHGPYNFVVSGKSASADKPVAGDFDGDGRADPGMVDSSGNWNLFLSASFYTRNGPWYLVLP